MIKFLFTLLFFVAANAFAAPPNYYWDAPDFPGAKWTSPAEGCTALVGRYNAANVPPKTQAFCRPPHSDAYINWFNPSVGNTDYRIYKQSICGDGSKPNIYVPLASQCPDIESNPCGETFSKKVTYVVSNNGKDIIYNPHKEGTPAIDEQQCTVKVESTVRCYTMPKSSTPSKSYCTFMAKQTGGKGQQGAPDPVSATETESDQERTDVPPSEGKSDGSCPAGTVNAGLSASGIPMCIGQGTDPKNTPPAPPKIEVEKNETLPDGSTQNTKTVTTTNTDGSKTTTKTVTITKPSGEKQTNQDKTTSTTPSGSAGKETQPDEKKGDLCKENPNLTICKNSTVTGKCGEISCMGDAIQCATLRAAAAMQCQQEKDIDALTKSPSTTLGNSILSGKDPKQGDIDLAMKPEEIDLSREKLDNQGFLGGGSCLRPITVNLPGGKTYTQSFDLVCEEIQPLRYVIMFMAYVSAYMIVVRTVLGS